MSEIKKLIETLHPLERKVLPILKTTLDFDEIVSQSKMQSVEVMRALQWLQNKNIIKTTQTPQEIIKLDENGKNYQKEGLPEKRFLESLDKESTLADVQKKTGLSQQESSLCMGMLRRAGTIDIKKGKDLLISRTKQGDDFLKKGSEAEKVLTKEFPLLASTLSKEEKAVVQELLKRKRILKADVQKIISVELTSVGKDLLKQDITDDFVDRLTPDMLTTGDWKNTKLRRYDVTINVPPIHGGKRHFVDQATRYIKNIWLELGFEEMEGNHVQSAFWDLDALFVPQDHPAREMQDTFYIKDPATAKLPEALVKKVQAMHEHGGDMSSTGWKYKWSQEVGAQNMLRTHTTVLSAQTIHKLKKEDLPAKFFSVGKVYRNEALSWKHLFEFTQVEGIVVDPNANLKNLKGYLTEFFQKLGFEKIRIRPAHFPYTEPSAEVDVWHPVKKSWVELGGSGIFRPEMVKPLLGFECPVIAWGLGLERSVLEYYQLKDVRDLYRNDLKQTRNMKLWLK